MTQFNVFVIVEVIQVNLNSINSDSILVNLNEHNNSAALIAYQESSDNLHCFQKITIV